MKTWVRVTNASQPQPQNETDPTKEAEPSSGEANSGQGPLPAHQHQSWSIPTATGKIHAKALRAQAKQLDRRGFDFQPTNLKAWANYPTPLNFCGQMRFLICDTRMPKAHGGDRTREDGDVYQPRAQRLPSHKGAVREPARGRGGVNHSYLLSPYGQFPKSSGVSGNAEWEGKGRRRKETSSKFHHDVQDSELVQNKEADSYD